MKPQQQNTDVKGKSHVFVQTPEGEQINVPSTGEKTEQNAGDEAGKQTAEHTPTTHSKEVTDGEDA